MIEILTDKLGDYFSDVNLTTILLFCLFLIVLFVRFVFKNKKDLFGIWDYFYNRKKTQEEILAQVKKIDGLTTEVGSLKNEFTTATNRLNDVESIALETTDRLEKLQEQTKENVRHINKYEDDRIHDRGQSFEKQKLLTEQIGGVKESVSDSMENLTRKLDKLNNRLDTLDAANRVLLGDKINSKYKQYLQQKYIPDDEYDEFVNIHSIYNLSGGNHSGDSKFNYCMEHLPILPSNIRKDND